MSKKEVLKEIFNNIVKSFDAANAAESNYVQEISKSSKEQEEFEEKDCENVM